VLTEDVEQCNDRRRQVSRHSRVGERKSHQAQHRRNDNTNQKQHQQEEEIGTGVWIKLN
jgi:hypothetical protein